MLTKRIILSPYSRWTGGKEKINAKNYPFMQELVDLMVVKGHKIIQVGIKDEVKLQGCEYCFDLPLRDLEKLLVKTGYFLSVDNFLHHMAHCLKVPGAVLWGPSDSRIFGYHDQLNIGKNREYLRPDQFGFYHLDWVWTHQDKGWYDPQTVYDILQRKKI